ncbi:hypothetical protein CKO09_02795 [Chromatium weissei]|nr:hypothetical protein [Chromatium weissei]
MQGELKILGLVKTSDMSPISNTIIANTATRTQTEGSVFASSTVGQISLESLKEQNRKIDKLDQRFSRLEQIIRVSGLDTMPHPLGTNAPLLTHIGEEYATRARFEERRKQLLDHSFEMRQHDLDTYSSENYRQISELYEKARPKRGTETQEQQTEREAALNKMMNKYPEAWSTNVAVAEQALTDAFNRNTSNVETYYQSLLDKSPYSEIVTEQGINAIPTLQTYLARQYVENGRSEDASAMLDVLSSQGDNIILEPNEMGEPTARTAQEIVIDLREKLVR